jgi:hypothetical protein
MNRLEAELQRLFPAPAAATAAHPDRLPAAGEGVQAMVLELARPPGWEALSRVWQGVQAEFELPPPAIAVSGLDSYQLWFPLSAPVPAGDAAAFLQALRRRYLADIAAERVVMTPSASPGAKPQRMPLPPPVEMAPGQWSAFITSDLAALFVDEPWLDLPPSADAQADLLSRLQGIAPDDFRRALERLRSADSSGVADIPAQAVAGSTAQAAATSTDPRTFLLQVMNDGAVALGLRIEAAKALLPYTEGRHP